MICRLIVLIVVLLISFVCSPSWAQDDGQLPESVSVKTYQEWQLEIIRLKEADRVRDLAMKNLIRRIEQLERAVAVDAHEEEPSIETSENTLSVASAEEKLRLQQEGEENYQLIEEAFEQRLSRQGGMLLAPYRLTYDLSFSYAHASYDSIVVDGFTVYPVLVIGDIVAEKVRRDIMTSNHTFRLGLPWETQLDLTFPFGYERKRSFRDDGTHVAHETNGLGDISLGLSYQLINGSTFWPDTVIALNWKSTSGDDPYRQEDTDKPSFGTGFETWGVSMTSIAVADPIVVFGGLSATYTPKSNKSIGAIRPGESFGGNLGMALSLNLDTSLSFNYSFNYSLETEINNQDIYGSDQTTSTFGIGLSRAKSDSYAMDIDLSIGLTRDATDFQLSVSFPFELSLLNN